MSRLWSWLDATPARRAAAAAGLVVGVTLLMVPFMLARNIQEDAFIHWQHARQFAATGEYGFNPGEVVSGSTSLLYVLICSAFYWLLPDASVPAVIVVVNALVMVSAVCLLVLILESPPARLTGSNAARMLLVCFFPPAVLLSISGMETAYLMLCLSLLVYGYQRQSVPALAGAAVIMPWVRLDSVIYVMTLVAVGVVLSRQHRRLLVAVGVANAVSAGIFAAVHRVVFGTFLPQSLIGKAEAYAVFMRPLSLSLNGMRTALFWLFGFVNTRYLYPLWWVFAAAGAGVLVVWVIMERRRADLPIALVAALTAWVMMPPLVYGWFTHVFEWYIWPSAVLYGVILYRVVWLRLQHVSQPARRAILLGAAALLAGLQLLVSLQNGAEDTLYRREIGLWLRNNTPAEASVFLEPVGYIGYYSERTIHDWTGLVSPQVVAYRRAYGSQWEQRYLADYQPDYIVVRDVSTIPAEAQYVGYEPVKRFTYQPELLTHDKLLRWIYGAGSAVDYVVLQRGS